MKNKVIALAFLLLLLTACQDTNSTNQNKEKTNTNEASRSEEVNSNNKALEETATQTESSKMEQEEDTNEEYSLIDETFLPNLSKGVIKYCELPLDRNIKASDVLARFGEPEWEDYWDGGYGRLYGDCLYFVENEKLDAKMTAIDYGSDNLAYTPSEIIKILGEPESKGISEIDGSYFITYTSGEYSASFEFEDENSPVDLLRVK